MITIKKVFSEDFQSVLELLDLFGNKDIDRNQWQRLCNPVCRKLANDFHGFALVDDGKFVGFIAGIQSQREINGKTHKFCNISSWIVHQNYRNEKKGLLLFKALMELEDFNFFVLSPVRHTLDYYTKLYGFKENTSKWNTVLALPSIRNIAFKSTVLINTTEIPNHLNTLDSDIYKDHQFPNVFHVLYLYKGEWIYSIIKPTLYSSYVLNSSFIIKYFTKAWFKIFKKDFFTSNILLGLVHYTNKPKYFSESLGYFRNTICKQIGVKGLSINDKYLLDKPIFSIKNTLNYSGLFKSNNLCQEDFDTLYSELILLQLKHFQL